MFESRGGSQITPAAAPRSRRTLNIEWSARFEADDQALTCGEFEFASCPDGQVVRRTDLERMNPWAPVFNDGLFGDCRPGLPAEDD